MKQVGSLLWPQLRVLQVYGANTGVGKTILSLILCRAFEKRLPSVHYLKPISTGPPEDEDKRHLSSFSPNTSSKCLFQFLEPVSPHLAARSSTIDVSDDAIRTSVYDELLAHAKNEDGVAVIEAAGGVMSPTPSGSSQADLYRPFRLPVLLVGDHRLGGIGTTISAWESLHIRGYDVQSIALFAEDKYDNHSYLKEYFTERSVHSFSIPPPPERKGKLDEDAKSMEVYYNNASNLENVEGFADRFLATHERRIEKLRAMPAEAHEAIWHPFMQHRERSADKIVVMDSAYNDYFQTYTQDHDVAVAQPSASSRTSMLQPAFDGSASWWTQGLGHGNPHMALTAAHAAGRYGHVMFAGAIHEPALRLAQILMNEMKNPRLNKVFYTDNGSTGMEVAVKMALRATSVREKWSADDDILILGLKGSYHGDTIGTMDCSEPSLFNKKVEWYIGRGYWFDFPQVKMREGQWIVEPPEEVAGTLGQTCKFDSLDDIFNFEQRSEQRLTYRKYFDAELSRLREEGKKLGALIIEPILLGAGGMLFVDPLYQRCLVEAVRNAGPESINDGLDWKGMPVIFDEVFTGLYRLGRFSSASFLDVDADIVVNAKLLTGGVVPLSTTTASQTIFEAFLSEDKSDALLHGHSYTAHAVGCAVANESLKTMKRLETDGSWDEFRVNWMLNDCSTLLNTLTATHHAWSVWSPTFVGSISHRTNVDYVFALGSVLAISLKDPTGAGYASTAATGLRDRLFAGSGQDEGVVHSRVLGNVLYLMAAMTTSPQTLKDIETKVLSALQ